MATSITTYTYIPQFASLDEVQRFCAFLSKSSIVPPAYRGRPEDIFVALQYGAEVGLSPMQALQNVAVINGRPSLPCETMLALVRQSGLLESIQEATTEEIQKTGVAWCEVRRKGQPYPIRHTYSIEDARRAHLWERRGKDGSDTPWTTYPYRMLQLRARSWCLRDGFSDVLRGLLSAEEAADIEAATPAARIEQATDQRRAALIERLQGNGQQAATPAPETAQPAQAPTPTPTPAPTPTPTAPAPAPSAPAAADPPQPAAAAPEPAADPQPAAQESERQALLDAVLQVAKLQGALRATPTGAAVIRGIYADLGYEHDDPRQVSPAQLAELEERLTRALARATAQRTRAR